MLIGITGSYAQQIYPECREHEEFATLWPDFEDSSRYFVCTGYNRFESRGCAPGTLFSFQQQTCVHPWAWEPPPRPPPVTTTTSSPGPSTPPTAPPTGIID